MNNTIEIKIPKEIKDYKEKFLFGLTVKQFICLALALLICVPLYIFGKEFMPEELVSWAVIFVAAPILGIGFIKYHKLKADLQEAERTKDLPFELADELKQKSERLEQLNQELNLNKAEDSIIDDEPEKNITEEKTKPDKNIHAVRR